MIRASGEEPVIIEYVQNPPSRERLAELLTAMQMTPRQLLREKGTPMQNWTSPIPNGRMMS